MRKKISWEIEIPFDEYPDQVKNIYQKNYINLRKEFANWIDKISKNHADNIDWWSLFPSSRNPNFSNIYKRQEIGDLLLQFINIFAQLKL